MDRKRPYICAHRGFTAAGPENSLVACAAAMAIGADEIEIDVQMTTDGVLVVLHDPFLERISNGRGRCWDADFAYMSSLDFGTTFSPEMAGMRIATLEEILELTAGKIGLNIHIKDPDNESPMPETYLKELQRVLRKYDLSETAYLTCGNNALIGQLRQYLPEFALSVLPNKDPYEDLVEKAVRHHAKDVGLYPPYFKYYDADYVEKTTKRAREAGMSVSIECNDPELAKRYAAFGIDTIVTDAPFLMMQALK